MSNIIEFKPMGGPIETMCVAFNRYPDGSVTIDIPEAYADDAEGFTDIAELLADAAGVLLAKAEAFGEQTVNEAANDG